MLWNMLCDEAARIIPPMGPILVLWMLFSQCRKNYVELGGNPLWSMYCHMLALWDTVVKVVITLALMNLGIDLAIWMFGNANSEHSLFPQAIAWGSWIGVVGWLFWMGCLYATDARVQPRRLRPLGSV